MEITQVHKKILRSLQGRSKKYGKFGFSKYEYEKYGLTEWKLRKIIGQLGKEGYIKKVGTERFIKNGVKMWRNVYEATEKLIDIVKSFTKVIENMNEKIIGWCKRQNPIEILRQHGIFVNGSGMIGDKKSKITVNRRTGAITDWKNEKKWNLFNYIRDKENCTILYFFTHFVGR